MFKKISFKQNFLPEIIPHFRIAPHPFVGRETIIPHEELKRETRYPFTCLETVAKDE
jgi:hypothetical protein